MFFIFLVWEGLVAQRPLIRAIFPQGSMEVQGKALPHNAHTLIRTGCFFSPRVMKL